jgi:hypothetical protein
LSSSRLFSPIILIRKICKCRKCYQIFGFHSSLPWVQFPVKTTHCTVWYMCISIVDKCIYKIASWQSQVSSSECSDYGVIFLKTGWSFLSSDSFLNTFTAKVDHSWFNNSCRRLPASTLVDLIFQTRSFSLGGKLVQ